MTYNTWRGSNVIKISEIYLTPEMYSVIVDVGRLMNGKDWTYECDSNLVKDYGLLPLSKVDNMLFCFLKNIQLPPVTLTRSRDSKLKYEILDGRHRIAMSIVFGFKEVPYILEES